MNLLKIAVFSSVLAANIILPKAFAEPEVKGTPAELMEFLKGPKEIPKRVSITGESEIKIQAEKALITLRVSSDNKSLEEALKANQALRIRVFSTLVKAGLGTNDIQAAKFSSTPKQGVFSEKAKSYRVDNAMKLTVYSEKQFQAVAALVDSAPEIHFLSTDFEHSEKENLKTKALAQACENAVARQRLFEEKLGIKLVPKSFTESDLPVTTPVLGVSTSEYEATKIGSSLFSSASSRVEMSTSFDELIFKAKVTVEYSVESK